MINKKLVYTAIALSMLAGLSGCASTQKYACPLEGTLPEETEFSPNCASISEVAERARHIDSAANFKGENIFSRNESVRERIARLRAEGKIPSLEEAPDAPTKESIRKAEMAADYSDFSEYKPIPKKRASLGDYNGPRVVVGTSGGAPVYREGSVHRVYVPGYIDESGKVFDEQYVWVKQQGEFTLGSIRKSGSASDSLSPLKPNDFGLPILKQAPTKEQIQKQEKASNFENNPTESAIAEKQSEQQVAAKAAEATAKAENSSKPKSTQEEINEISKNTDKNNVDEQLVNVVNKSNKGVTLPEKKIGEAEE